MLAKAFDYYCQHIGYEKSLPTIERWINGDNPNVKSVVIEGLRIWTNRPYFKENPENTIKLIAKLRQTTMNIYEDLSVILCGIL